MGKTVFQGAGVALVTPMYPDLRINYSMLDQMIDRQLTGHTDAIVVVGTSGEGSTLTDEEHCEVVEHTVRRVNHRIPVIAGVGSNNTSHAVELSKGAARAGADALLHVTPYYNKASQRGLVQHFNACANATDLPVILYNIPSYDEDTVTDQPMRQIVAELIREKALHALNEEIPHGIAVVIDTFKDRKSPKGIITDIDATIICERDSHKGIIIGKGGEMLKKIGTNARYEIEKQLGNKVNLKLWVKVKKEWRDSDILIKNYGYDKKDLKDNR